jgi:hypothetical protein
MDLRHGVASDSRDGSKRPDASGKGRADGGKRVANAAPGVRLDLVAVERSLRAVQQVFDGINATLETPRDPLSDRVVTNLMAGYAYLDELIGRGVNPLALGNSGQLLELNQLVLCGPGESAMKDCAKHRAETERRFYDPANRGSVGELMSALAAHRDESVWRRAARAYIQVLSQPQLFIEGNHRTGALIMSAMLVWDAKPPFVLSVKNAKAYFDPSSLAKDSRKHSLRLALRRPKLSKRLAGLLKDEGDPGYLKR